MIDNLLLSDEEIKYCELQNPITCFHCMKRTSKAQNKKTLEGVVKWLDNKALRKEIELCFLSFASDYHRYFREEIAIKGINSHPYFIDKAIQTIKQSLQEGK